MMLTNYLTNGFNLAYYALPSESFEVRRLLNSYRSILGEEMLTRFMTPDFSKANIQLFTHISSSKEFLETRRKILSYVETHFSKDIIWTATGLGMVLSASSQLLTTGQIESLSITLIIVFGIMFILFLSYKVGLVAMVPNIFPIIVNFGGVVRIGTVHGYKHDRQHCHWTCSG
jgi:predicted RND superfamily exporter protein